ncbi:FAD-dependent monooxygenase [Streptomyces sp. NPDC046939]|uniref:FAD-dependent monooxygenase n=1 Tax=Streptomyces sp. NPDC046939 TaxID=3155376 RepID=UPI0033C56AA7
MRTADGTKRRAPGTERPRIAVIGAGIGGLTLAGALTATGTPYVIHEQTRELAEVGAGVQLSPNAIRPLLRLGLGPALEEHAVRIEAMEVRGWNGRPIARTPLGHECERMFSAPYLTIHRAHLHEALLSSTDRDSLNLGRRLRTLEEHPGTGDVRLTFDDGTSSTADVVIGADGIHSTVREVLRRDDPVFSGLGIYRGLVPVDALPPTARERLVRLWLGPGGHFVCYPVASGKLLSYAATVPLDGPPPPESWSREGDPEALRAAFGTWTGLVADIVHAVETTHQWALHDRAPLKAWSTRRITLVGDAAHPMLPFMAQGANQAIEDAMDLAACLTGASHGAIADQLSRYESLRMPRTAEIQRGSRGNAGVLHLPDGPAQRRRDAQMAVHASLRDRAPLYAHETGRSVVPLVGAA